MSPLWDRFGPRALSLNRRRTLRRAGARLALVPLFGCGGAHRTAYMHDGNYDADDEWYRVLPR